MDADTVMTRVSADMGFYRNSGGGVTFSGGEPFAQPEFLLELLGRSRSLGIATAVETCGLAETEAFLAAEPLIDLFLFDLKLADSDEHRRWTGVGNERILANLASLAAGHQDKIILRVPIVSGLTDTPENIAAIAGIARAHGLFRIDLQPYHPLGNPKYAEIGRPAPPEIPPPEPADLEGLIRRFSDLGIVSELA
jgi:pyruvate formate lyase activating enzyme